MKNEKNVRRDANTARWRVRQNQKISPRRRPFPEAQDGQILTREMVTTFTYKPSLVMIDARNFELSW